MEMYLIRCRMEPVTVTKEEIRDACTPFEKVVFMVKIEGKGKTKIILETCCKEDDQ